jgi:hypothetical protein
MAKKLIHTREAVRAPQTLRPPQKTSDELLLGLIRKQEVRLLLSPRLNAFFGEDFRPWLRPPE